MRQTVLAAASSGTTLRIELPNGFTPRDYQVPFMRYMDHHANGGRAVWVVHRRGGKDLTAMHQLVKMAHQRVGAYWHVFPTFEQGRKAIWEGFLKTGQRTIDNVFPAPIVAKRNEQEMKIELRCGSIYRIIGSDKIEVVGAGPVGVIFSEFSLSKPKAWDLIAPMLRENEGWAAFVFTPRGNNHAKKLFDVALKQPSWFCQLYTLRDTMAFDPDLTVQEERAAGRPEALIRQEYFCDWTAANAGSVFGDLVECLEKAGRVLEFVHPRDGIFTSWDLGISDATAIWFWRMNENRMPDLIDYYESSGKPLSHYFDIVDGKGYTYTKHWLPHDARARSLQTGVATVEQFLGHWPDQIAICPELSIADGIEAARWLLQQKIRFHTRCREGVEALKQYHYAWDGDRKVFGTKPEHDWSSHPSDAFRYLALVVKDTELMTRPEPKPKPFTVSGPPRYTMDELWETREKHFRERKI